MRNDCWWDVSLNGTVGKFGSTFAGDGIDVVREPPSQPCDRMVRTA